MKKLQFFCPPETTETLRCPERGFYSILRFTADENAAVPRDHQLHPDDSLILAEINLCNYSRSELTENALSGIDGLFRSLRETGCGLIVRFLYDWSGRNIITEPKTIDIILKHIEQLGPIIVKNSDIICLLQGLFIGNWGEMHGSRFIRGDLLKRLYAALSRAVEGRVRIAVRTPALWRAVTGMSFDSYTGQDGSLPGLFNDGMLGNESEYGTYSADPVERKKQLRLQEQLSCFVPYGGEVVGTAPQSDPANAMAALERTKVSYLNRLYDDKTLEKWKNTNIKDGSIWNGMSYFDYAGAHLGYRFVIQDVKLRQGALSGNMTARIRIGNTGFAPICHDTAAELVFAGESREWTFPLTGSVNSLVRRSQTVSLTSTPASLKELPAGAYEIRFRLKSLKYNSTIPMANQGCDGSGCLIGRYTV